MLINKSSTWIYQNDYPTRNYSQWNTNGKMNTYMIFYDKRYTTNYFEFIVVILNKLKCLFHTNLSTQNIKAGTLMGWLNLFL